MLLYVEPRFRKGLSVTQTVSRLHPFNTVRKVAEQKFPEFFELSCRILPRILCSEFVLRILPEIFEEFLCLLRGRRRPETFTKNLRHFSLQKSQANWKKKSAKFLWRVGKVTVQHTFMKVWEQNAPFYQTLCLGDCQIPPAKTGITANQKHQILLLVLTENCTTKP